MFPLKWQMIAILTSLCSVGVLHVHVTFIQSIATVCFFFLINYEHAVLKSFITISLNCFRLTQTFMPCRRDAVKIMLNTRCSKR